MRALLFQSVGRVSYERTSDPVRLDPGDAIVRVRRAAVCGSDLHVFHGREAGIDPGTVMGHEFVGEVVDVGPGVRAFWRGDVVVSPFSTACGACEPCDRRLSARCTSGALFGWVQRGVGLQGAQAELVRVPFADATLVRVPEGLDLDIALLLGDVLPTGLYCALRAEVGPGGTCVVLGCGPVGLAAVLAARDRRPDQLFAVDAIPERLALAARFGATPLDLGGGDVVERVLDATRGFGADSVLEAVGNPASSRLAWQIVRPGGIVSAVGVHNEAQFAFTPTDAYDKNLTYRIGRCPARSLMPELLPWAQSRRDDVAALITHRMPLEQGAAAYALFDAKRDGCVKVVLQPA